MAAKVLIVTAAGSGSRFGGQNKCLATLDGTTVLQKSLDAFLGVDWTRIIVTTSESSLDAYREVLTGYPETVRVVVGGKTRFESVKLAIEACGETTGTVLVHDAARPFVSKALIERVLAASSEFKAVIPGVPVVDTIKVVNSQMEVLETPARESLRAIQTPQRFDLEALTRCYEQAYNDEITDEAMLMELNGHLVTVIDGELSNRKITYFTDLQ